MQQIKTTWNATDAILHSMLRGVVTVHDAQDWKSDLQSQVDRIADGTSYKLLFNLHGYEPATLEAHKEMRMVIPLLLASSGMRPAVADLFEGDALVDVEQSPRIRCVAFANVHHDPNKMAKYQTDIGRPNQQFFWDENLALNWLLAQPV